MWTLGIETSGRIGSVALLEGDARVVERRLFEEGRRHARTLVHELQGLLAEAGISPQQCDLIAVSIGPGSFTGLRIGVVCAKTWAFATGCRLVGVDTLQAIAENAPVAVREIDVISDAQRGDLYVGRYAWAEAGGWTSQAGIRIVPVDEWLHALPGDRFVSGPAVESLRQRLEGRAILADDQTCLPSAVAVARIGKRQADVGETSDCWSLEPVYLRNSAAEEKQATHRSSAREGG